jgi:hypothetical protein
MEAALYYPNLIPPLDWMKHSLLFFDKISSIVPIGYETGSSFPRRISNKRDMRHLRWLEGEGHWLPVDTERVESELFSSMYQAVEALAETRSHQTDVSRIKPTVLFSPKLAWGLQDELISSGLAHRDGDYLVLPTYVLYAIQSVIAMCVARYPQEVFGLDSGIRRVTPGTNDAEYFSFATELPLEYDDDDISYLDYAIPQEPMTPMSSIRKPERSACYQILLDGPLPVPSATTSFPAIIEFRDSYHDELVDFRLAVNGMIMQALQAPSPMDVLMDNRTRIQRALADVRKAARSRRIRLTVVSVTIATGVAVASHFGGEEAVKVLFEGIGGAAAIELISAATHLKSRNEFSYLIRSHDFQG